MTQFSHSRIESFMQCPYKYKLRYFDKLQMLSDYEATNAMILGTTMHMGIEQDIPTAIQWYYNQFPILTDEQISEAMKLEVVIQKMCDVLPKGGKFEVEIIDNDFKGFIDYIVEVAPNLYDLYDFKYSNHFTRYLQSDQLHLYKYYFEKHNRPKKIRNLYFMFGPKIQIKQEEKENILAYRRRFMSELREKEVTITKVEYNPNKIIEYLTNIKQCLESTEFNKEPSKLCYFCEYRSLCEDGKTYEIKESDNMILPSTERRNIQKDVYKKIWIYGAPFSGKTTFVDKAPNPLNLNTDGNIKYVTMPVVSIKDEVRTEGRQIITTQAWEKFKDAITELSKKENEFETIVVDLLEDTYEYCRLYMYEKLGITHESDDSFRAWDKVRTEFLSTIRKLLNLDYNIVLISHEDTSKDLMKKSGDKVTAIKPNINDKIANKIAGMVDIVARVVADGESRVLDFKSDDVVFGGGRLALSKTTIPLNWESLMNIYEEQKGEIVNAGNKTNEENTKKTRASRKSVQNTEEEVLETVQDSETTTETPTRKRRSKTEESDTVTETNEIMVSMEHQEESESESNVPKRKRRGTE